MVLLGVLIMKTSARGIDLLMELEGIKLKPYDDRTGMPLKQWNRCATIGVGYLIPQKEWEMYKNGITGDQAEDLLKRILPKYEAQVNASVPGVLKQSQYDALVCLVYNIGDTEFAASSVVRMLNGKKGNYATLEQAWKAFNKDEGRVNPGLVNRRAHEWQTYATGVY